MQMDWGTLTSPHTHHHPASWSILSHTHSRSYESWGQQTHRWIGYFYVATNITSHTHHPTSWSIIILSHTLLLWVFGTWDTSCAHFLMRYLMWEWVRKKADGGSWNKVSAIGNRSSLIRLPGLFLSFASFRDFNERQEVSTSSINQSFFWWFKWGGLLFNDLKDCGECTVVYTSNCYHVTWKGCGTLWPCHLH